MGVVRKRIDHPAVLDLPALTGMNHPLEFDLESLQALNPVVHLIQVFLRNLIDLGTGLLGAVGQLQQLPDLRLGKTQFPAMPDKRQPGEMLLSVNPLISSRAPRFR